jgi:hypothetical protein
VVNRCLLRLNRALHDVGDIVRSATSAKLKWLDFSFFISHAPISAVNATKAGLPQNPGGMLHTIKPRDYLAVAGCASALHLIVQHLLGSH